MEAGGIDMAVICMSAVIIFSALSLLWGIAGAVNPAALFFAMPEYRTRRHAVIFPLWVSVTCLWVTVTVTATGNGDWFIWVSWIIAGIIVFFISSYFLGLCGYLPKKTEQTEASALQGKADSPPDQQQPVDKRIKTALAKVSFTVCSALIVLKAWRLLQGEIWLVWLLGLLAVVSAIWALAGLYNPRVLFFAHPTNHTRYIAFIFPLKLFLTFAFLAGVESSVDPTTNTNGIPSLIIGAFLLMLFVINVYNLNKTPVIVYPEQDFPDVRIKIKVKDEPWVEVEIETED